MIVFPNCKINLGLLITGKRNDGYHNIETVFFPVPLHDALEIIPSVETSGEAELFTSSGLPISGETAQNLCVKALYLLKKKYPQIPDIKIHLHKAIPMGAGLGGGSADAAFMLSLLNTKYGLELSNDELLQYALQLGSDCPFFIFNKPCIATGRGELMQPIHINLSGYRLVLVNPGIHVNTAWAFAQLNAGAQQSARREELRIIISKPVADWKSGIVNDFEKPVFEKYPGINNIKQSLYQDGAVFASMSGSGSTVYGIFRQGDIPRLNFPETYFVKNILL